jgi:chromosome segregation ATPase
VTNPGQEDSVDLFGTQRRRLREELEAAHRERDEALDRAASQSKKASAASRRAAERQDRLMELQRVIDELRAELAQRRLQGAPAAQVHAAEEALQDALAIHSRATR